MDLWVLYADESGVPIRHPSQTSHYALAGVAIPACTWIDKQRDLDAIRTKWGFPGQEFHVAWLLALYPEQQQVPGFDLLSRPDRADRVNRLRAAKEARIEQARDAATAAGQSPTPLSQTLRDVRAFHRKSRAYVHLTLAERREVARDVTDLVGSWADCVLFGEVLDKGHPTAQPPDEQAYEQVVSRFEGYLQRIDAQGIVAYDQNETVADRVTGMTARLQEVGGLWRQLKRIACHPFFVASHMSDLIQVADVVSYALRRCCENGEEDLLRRCFGRFDRTHGRLVGLRHYRGSRRCTCMICSEPR